MVIRRGMVTIGVAVQAETFTNDSSPQSSSSASSSSKSSFSKSSIFLSPNHDGSPQTLKITFAYNKETNLPEIILNLDGESGQTDKYLQLKNSSTEIKSLAELYAPKKSNGEDLQVFYFDDMESTNSLGASQITGVPAIKSIQDMRMTSIESQEIPRDQDKTLGQVGEGDITPSDPNVEGSTNNTKLPRNKKSSCSMDPEESTEHTQTTQRRSLHNKKVSKKVDENNGNGNSFEKVARRKIKSKPSPIQSPTKDDKSKIPIIHSAATGFMPCEYYRQKWLQEVGCTDFPVEPWANYYGSIQKTAGQKVVNKLTAQQKHLEEQAAAQKKRTEFVFHEELGFCEIPPEKIPLKKKQTRLEPLRTVPKCY